MNIILFLNKKDCTGCSVCEAVCPLQSIKMVSDEQGFLYPVIDKNKCVACGKCIEVCPIKNY